MPNTTNFNFPTPADTDLVKDGAAAIRSLGNSIDSTFVDLKGGTTGQILAKNSNTDMDFTWTSDAVGIQATIFDAKGDLIAASAADTAARLASSGVNGNLLTVDTSTTTGLKWAAPVAAPLVWTAVANTTFSTNTTDYTFSGLSGYDNYILTFGGLNFPADSSTVMSLQLNGDTGSNYISQGWSDANATVNPDSNARTTGTSFNLKARHKASSTANQHLILMSGTNGSGNKWIRYDGLYREWSNDAVGARALMYGWWTGSGTVTSIKIAFGNNVNAGTMFLYGA